jgi:hypothetical protein
VLRRIRLFADHDTVDFHAALPGDTVLAGPHPELLVRTRRPRVIAVVNSKGGHGCSSLGAGLAQALAGGEHRVLYLVTSRSGQDGPGLQEHRWPEADLVLAAVAQDPDRHVHPRPLLRALLRRRRRTRPGAAVGSPAAAPRHRPRLQPRRHRRLPYRASARRRPHR